MNNDYVLKHVARPPILLYADFRATLVVVGISVVLLFKSTPLISISTFAVLQTLIIGLTKRDPFFINVFMARPKKHTKNRLDKKKSVYR